MYTITIITDPNGLHLETYLGRFTALAALAKLLELTEAFQSLKLNVESDDESPLCYWLNNSDGNAVFYVLTQKV